MSSQIQLLITPTKYFNPQTKWAPKTQQIQYFSHQKQKPTNKVKNLLSFQIKFSITPKIWNPQTKWAPKTHQLQHFGHQKQKPTNKNTIFRVFQIKLFEPTNKMSIQNSPNSTFQPLETKTPQTKLESSKVLRSATKYNLKIPNTKIHKWVLKINRNANPQIKIESLCSPTQIWHKQHT